MLYRLRGLHMRHILDMPAKCHEEDDKAKRKSRGCGACIAA